MTAGTRDPEWHQNYFQKFTSVSASGPVDLRHFDFLLRTGGESMWEK